MRFGDLYEIPSRNGLTKPRAIRGEGIKFINMGELFENDRIGDIEMDRAPVTEKEFVEALVEEGDLLFARQSLVREGAGKCSIVTEVKEPTTFDSHLIRVRLKRELANPNFYRFYFSSHLSPIPGIVSQCAQAGIKGNDLKELDVICPPIHQQDRIAEILSAYDELIENNRKQIKLLEEAAQRLYKEWFVDFRFPGYKTVSINPDTKLPKTWADGCLLDYVGFVRGRSYGSENLVENGSKRLVNLNNVAAYGGWASGAEKGYEGSFKAEQQVYEGDVLMAVTDMTKERRLVGHAARVPKGLDGSIISMDLIKLDSDVFPSEYLYCYLRYSGVAEMIAMLANGTNVLHLKPEELNRVEIPIPDIAVCRAYADQVKSQLKLIDYLEMQISSAREARDRLLPKLMSGEIEVG